LSKTLYVHPKDRGVELLIDPLTLALNNQVRIFANLLCDVGVRYPAAFAVTAPVTWGREFPAPCFSPMGS
jgi:hypothetical protein